jgi:SAM-dependent methyltransferase
MRFIEGFECYSPELATQNSGFDSKSFELLYQLEDKSFWFTNRNLMFTHLLGKYSISKDFLEIGCGSAYVINNLSQKFTELNFTGSEIYVEGLKYAQRRVQKEVKLIQYDATEINFDEQFDGIGAFDVIEHIDEDEKVLMNIYKSLRPNGRVFISVPQYMFIWSQEDDYACHKRRYTRKELKSKLVNSGFEVEFITSYMFLLFPVMLFFRITGGVKKTEEEMTQALYPGKFMNSLLSLITYLDIVLIRMGISLPWGGSLVLVGRKVRKEDVFHV